MSGCCESASLEWLSPRLPPPGSAPTLAFGAVGENGEGGGSGGDADAGSEVVGSEVVVVGSEVVGSEVVPNSNLETYV